MTTAVERFLRYVKYDTKSDPDSPTCPSTAKQLTLGKALVEEMLAMGIADAHMDENGYVFGTVPGDPRLPTIGRTMAAIFALTRLRVSICGRRIIPI